MKKIFLIMTISTLLLSANISLAKPEGLVMLDHVNIATAVDNTKIELKFDGKPGREKIQYQDDFVQIEFPGTYTDPPKQWLKVEDDLVKNIFVYQFDAKTVRLRLFTYDRALNMRGRISISGTNNGLIISYGQKQAATDKKTPMAAKADVKKGLKKRIAAPVEIILPETTGNVSQSEEGTPSADSMEAAHNAIENHAETRVEQSPPEQSPADAGTEQDKVDAPPVKQEAGEKKDALLNDSPNFTGSIIKMVTALGIVLSLLFAIVFFVKKYLGKKIGLAGQEQKIRVVTSTYLGPKKSIALVEVAGEKIVVGITATNISMLTRVGKEEDFEEVLKEQIKPEPANEKVELQDELWEKTQVDS